MRNYLVYSDRFEGRKVVNYDFDKSRTDTKGVSLKRFEAALKKAKSQYTPKQLAEVFVFATDNDWGDSAVWLQERRRATKDELVCEERRRKMIAKKQQSASPPDKAEV